MEEKQEMKEKKKPVNKRNLVLILILILSACVIGGLGYTKGQPEKAQKKAEEKIDTSQFNADSLVGRTEVLDNRYVMAGNPSAIPQLSMVTTDTDVVKSVEAHLENVDISTPGEYDVTYDVTVYAKALQSAMNGEVRSVVHDGAKGQTCKIKVNGKITVVDEETAKELKSSGRHVYGFQLNKSSTDSTQTSE